MIGIDSVLFLLNERTYTGKSLSNYIAKIRDLHINNNLKIEGFKGFIGDRKALTYFIPSSTKIEIILYDNHIDINKEHSSYSTLELISLVSKIISK